MSQLQKLNEKYPSLYYHQDTDTLCTDVNEEPVTVETDGIWLLEEHFNGQTVQTDNDSYTLTGAEYVKHLGGAVLAFKEMGIDTW